MEHRTRAKSSVIDDNQRRIMVKSWSSQQLEAAFAAFKHTPSSAAWNHLANWMKVHQFLCTRPLGVVIELVWDKPLINWYSAVLQTVENEEAELQKAIDEGRAKTYVG